MNIIVIVIDTLRYDYIGANGNDAIKTPNLDKLTESSWAFDRSYTASYPTIPHRTDALTGRYGAPLHAWKPLDCDVLTIPRALAEHGYCTQLIHDTPHLVNGGHNFDFPFHAWTFVRGAEVDRPWIDDSAEPLANWCRDPLFDVCDESLRDKEGKTRPPAWLNVDSYERANRKRREDTDWNCARLFLTACEFLQDNRSRDNFFLWVDCFDPHEPWDAPPEFVKMYDDTPGYDGRVDPRSFSEAARNNPDLPEAAVKRIKAFYAAKVTWVDQWLGEFMDTLERTGLHKNTAVLLTADHGTNLWERGKFGKGYPVREQEAHTPFIVRVPGGGSGRSGIFVQPQDIFATVMGLAGLKAPEGIDSHDVLKIAREGSSGPRTIALAGRVASQHWSKPDNICFTVFDDEWCLECAVKPEQSSLTRLGSVENVAAENADVVERLRAAGVDEIARRGADPKLVEYLRREGKGEFPKGCKFSDAHPAPPGWKSYFQNIYHEDGGR